MSYRYLRNSTNTSDSTGLDDNQVDINYHDADTSMISESVGAGKSSRILHFAIVADSLAGTAGSLTLQFSDDGLNWSTALDDSDASVEFTIDNTFSGDYITIIDPPYPHYRFNYDAGSVTAGTIAIRVTAN